MVVFFKTKAPDPFGGAQLKKKKNELNYNCVNYHKGVSRSDWFGATRSVFPHHLKRLRQYFASNYYVDQASLVFV